MFWAFMFLYCRPLIRPFGAPSPQGEGFRRNDKLQLISHLAQKKTGPGGSVFPYEFEITPERR